MREAAGFRKSAWVTCPAGDRNGDTKTRQTWLSLPALPAPRQSQRKDSRRQSSLPPHCGVAPPHERVLLPSGASPLSHCSAPGTGPCHLGTLAPSPPAPPPAPSRAQRSFCSGPGAGGSRVGRGPSASGPTGASLRKRTETNRRAGGVPETGQGLSWPHSAGARPPPGLCAGRDLRASL